VWCANKKLWRYRAMYRGGRRKFRCRKFRWKVAERFQKDCRTYNIFYTNWGSKKIVSCRAYSVVIFTNLARRLQGRNACLRTTKLVSRDCEVVRLSLKITLTVCVNMSSKFRRILFGFSGGSCCHWKENATESKLVAIEYSMFDLLCSDGQITNQITSTNHKSFAKMIQI